MVQIGIHLVCAATDKSKILHSIQSQHDDADVTSYSPYNRADEETNVGGQRQEWAIELEFADHGSQYETADKLYSV